jgi:hypothetical protein
MDVAACQCGCDVAQDGGAHAIAAALARDDVDAALQAGLLTTNPCPSCTQGCQATMLAARDARRIALAARDRFRAREARLARRQEERRQRGRITATDPRPGTPALPPAAAAALARARDKAAGRRSP